MTFAHTFTALTLLGLLAGCGGGGAITVDANSSTVELLDTGSTATSDLSTLIAEPAGAETSGGELQRGSDRITIGGLPGSINAARDTVTFDSGGTAGIEQGPTDFVAFVTASPTAGDPFFGIIGIPTEVGDLPGGSASFAGDDGARVVILSGTAFYELEGAVTAEVDFGDGLVNFTLSDLDGILIDGGTTAVTDVATIEVTEAALDDGSFTGGAAEFTSTEIAKTLSGSEDVSTEGALFGPDADEIGGAVVIDDAGNRDLQIFGYFIAD